MATGSPSKRSSSPVRTAGRSRLRLPPTFANGSFASWLASQPDAARQQLVAGLTEHELRVLRYEWAFWARPNQLPPPDADWLFWLLMTGRGFGKTRSGAEWIQDEAEHGTRDRWIALVAANPADARDFMIQKAPSAILNIAPPWARPLYQPSTRSLVWPSGAHATVYSAEKPDQLRGFSGDRAWLDEFAKFRNPRAVLDNLLFGMREAKLSEPKICITTTPKPLELLAELVKDPDCRTVTGTSYDNVENLAPSWFAKILRRYEGTATGEQEIYGRLLDEMPGALWKRQWIDHLARRERGHVDGLERIAVAVDPPGSSGKGGAECGIVAAGVRRGANGFRHLHVLEDASVRAKPAVWGKAAVDCYHAWKADVLVGEKNFGGEMVEHVIRTVDGGREVSYRDVSASRGKHIRAQPVSSLYEQGRGHHCGTFAALEDELCTWEPEAEPPKPSPNRLDALVWAATELVLGYEAVTDIEIPVLRRGG